MCRKGKKHTISKIIFVNLKCFHKHVEACSMKILRTYKIVMSN